MVYVILIVEPYYLEYSKVFDRNKLGSACGYVEEQCLKELGLSCLFDSCYEQFAKVRLEQDGSLVWPVTLMYPENHYQAPDYIQSFPEGDTFADIFKDAFSDAAEWDPQHRYKLDTINVYYKSIRNKFVLVKLSDTLGKVLAQKDFLVEDGTPIFFILVRGSELEKMLVFGQ